jgi:hopanoid biosynthesis associated protein HpnK
VTRLILTADDFGIALPVNEAVERAHRDGVLGAASLMVGGAAAEDAVLRARRMPDLRVGLHLVVVEGRPVLPPEAIPDLVDARGELPADLFAAGLRFFFLPRVRRQLEAEIRAQFEAFRKTGLDLDHVNAHDHMHLHPTVLAILLRVGREFGMRAVRVPWEPRAPAGGRGARGLGARAADAALAPWIALLRARVRRAGLRSNDFVLGLRDSGAMDEARVLALLDALPEGVGEIYFHVATHRCPEIDRHAPAYRPLDELAALTSRRVREALERREVARIGFRDLGPSGSAQRGLPASSSDGGAPRGNAG